MNHIIKENQSFHRTIKKESISSDKQQNHNNMGRNKSAIIDNLNHVQIKGMYSTGYKTDCNMGKNLNVINDDINNDKIEGVYSTGYQTDRFDLNIRKNVNVINNDINHAKIEKMYSTGNKTDRIERNISIPKKRDNEILFKVRTMNPNSSELKKETVLSKIKKLEENIKKNIETNQNLTMTQKNTPRKQKKFEIPKKIRKSIRLYNPITDILKEKSKSREKAQKLTESKNYCDIKKSIVSKQTERKDSFEMARSIVLNNMVEKEKIHFESFIHDKVKAALPKKIKPPFLESQPDKNHFQLNLYQECARNNSYDITQRKKALEKIKLRLQHS